MTKLLLLPGDGIGPEVSAVSRRILDVLAIPGLEVTEALFGGASIDRHGVPLADDVLAQALASDAVLMGAVGGPQWAAVAYDKRPEAGLLKLRAAMNVYANLRPARCFAALADASSLKRELVEGLDILFVRELVGGVYFGEPKEITDLGNGQKRAIDTQVYDTYEIERISGVAFELARTRRNEVCSMEKHNVMKSGVLWKEVVAATHKARYSDVKLSHMLADAGGLDGFFVAHFVRAA